MEETIKLSLNFEKREEVLVEKKVFSKYVKEFVEKFAKEGRHYRIGDMSGKVIFEGRMYGEISENAKNLPSAKELEENVQALNSRTIPLTFRYNTWIDLDNIIMDKYEDNIIEYIKEINGITSKNKRTQLRTKTYSFNGKEVVFYMINIMSSDPELYAVPVELVKELELEDYDGEEISRWEPFLDKIEEFKIDHMYSWNGD